MVKKKKTKKKGSVGNKSQMIRDYMEANPNAGPKAVSQALSKPGFKVTAAFVSTVKSTDKRKGGGSKKISGRGSVSMTALMQAKRLVDQMGSVDNARAALDAYASLVN